VGAPTLSAPCKVPLIGCRGRLNGSLPVAAGPAAHSNLQGLDVKALATPVEAGQQLQRLHLDDMAACSTGDPQIVAVPGEVHERLEFDATHAALGT